MEDPPSSSEIDGIDYDGDYKPTFHSFYNLMKFRVGRILLVSSLYDAFTLEEDGLLFEQISEEYRDLALPFPPQVIRVSSGKDALEELESSRYDLVITMARLGDMDPYEFGRKAKEIQKSLPVILLLTDMGDIPFFHRPGVSKEIDKTFYWNGDSTLYMAIIKYVEDMRNAVPDTSTGLVRAILIIEDSPRFYSIFLPLLYTEIMRQTRDLLTEGLNEHEKMLRIRSRPKVLLAETYEEALKIYREFEPHIMGVISDISYMKDGKMEEEAGFIFAKEVKHRVPVLLQSSREEFRKTAESMGVSFVDKRSEALLQEVRDFFKDRLGFGEFVFMLPDGTEVGRASDIKEFLELAPKVPLESLKYHGSLHQFSNWLMARGELSLARALRPKKVSDFENLEEMREHLIRSIRESRREKQLGVITDFSRQDFEFEQTFTRLGGGSLGGKGRGIAFLSSLLNQSMINKRLKGCKVKVPETLVIGTDEFDTFMRVNDLKDVLLEGLNDSEVAEKFLSASLTEELRQKLRRYLDKIRWPIAVRSSSLLEDSQNQPFAGIYATYILPNNCGEDDTRLDQLEQAIKLVYASTYYRRAKAYIRTTVHMPEEEKMGVVLQKLIGSRHGDRFYPVLSGVAQSHNFYPVSPLKREEGIVSVALGLGKIVVEGEKVLNFSPEHPDVIPGFHSPEDVLKNSQEHFYALDLSRTCFDLSLGEEVTLQNLDIGEAERDNTLDMLASTFDADDNRLRDGVGGKGPKLITFAGILKYGMFPLVDIIKEMLRIGQRGMGRPVEIEFAANMNGDEAEFHVLQIRPLVTMRERGGLNITSREKESALICTSKAMGNGLIERINDIIYVPPETFDATRTVEIAREIGGANAGMDGTPYILIGPGRWGTRDRFLGIPVEWDQISWAKAIVEASIEGFRIDPSHGTHFFHNITALGIPYFTVGPNRRDERVDWGRLSSFSTIGSYRYIRHVRAADPLMVKVDGRSGSGIIGPSDIDGSI